MATSRYSDSSPNTPYMMNQELGTYDTSSESSASSPHAYDNAYGSNGFMAYPSYPSYPMPFSITSEGYTPPGLIPVELDIESLYEDHDRRRKKSADGKAVSPQVHSRRRAQNRASQRAFRDRKEKHMRELEQKLEELTCSYNTLSADYASVKQELDTLRKEQRADNLSHNAKNYPSRGWEESNGEILDPLLFDVSAFCFDRGDDQGRQN